MDTWVKATHVTHDIQKNLLSPRIPHLSAKRGKFSTRTFFLDAKIQLFAPNAVDEAESVGEGNLPLYLPYFSSCAASLGALVCLHLGLVLEHHLSSSVSGSYVATSDCSRVLFASREDTAFIFSLRKLRKWLCMTYTKHRCQKNILQSKHFLGLPCVRGRLLMKKKEPSGSVRFLLEDSAPSWCRTRGVIWGLWWMVQSKSLKWR